MSAPILVPTTRTVVTPEALAPAFARSFLLAHGELPEVVDVAIVCAKLIMECGWPDGARPQACWCWNVGNIRGVSGEGLYCILRGAHEFLPAGVALPAGYVEIPTPAGHTTPPGTRAVLPPSSQQRFRAYTSLFAACDEYVQVLGARFGRSWRELTDDRTTAEAFVFAMKADGYFTGSVNNYAATVASITRTLIPRVERVLERDAEVPIIERLSVLDGSIVPGVGVTPIRASEGEHTIRLDPDPEF